MQEPDIPGYRIDRQLGSGGMARVFLAVQESLNREVALKVMIPGLSVDETSCHRFLKEGRIAAQLNHQHLLTVYDIGVHEDQYYMASEYLPGGTAADRIEAGIDADEAVRIIAQVAQGLVYVHARGFVHRDVKPHNLLFRANGECVLGDFGIAKAVDSMTNSTKLGTSIGTPQYMSPEQAKGEKVDPRTDLYALGVVFHELLTGRPPFDADDPFSVALMQINDPVPALPAEHARFQPIIERLMAKDREARYPSAEAFLEELEAVTGFVAPSRKTTRRNIAPTEDAAASSAPAVSPGLRRLLSAAVGLLLLAMIAYGGWVLVGGARAPAPAEELTAGSVEALLAQAAAAAAAGDYFSPADGSAHALLRRALEAEPGSEAVRRALRDLVAAVERAAEARWQDGDVAGARRLASEGLRRYPSDPGLRYLLARMDAATGEGAAAPEPPPAGPGTEAAESAAALMTRAERFFDIGDYGAATPLYQAVVAAQPGNETAQQRLESIGANLAATAERYLERGERERAAALLEQAAAADPDGERIDALREALAAARAADGP